MIVETRATQALARLLAADGRDFTAVSREHPTLGTLDGYQWVASIGGHEARHTAQIREAAAELTTRGSATASAD